MSLQKVLRADSAGPAAQRLYENSHIALAGLVPAALLTSEGSGLRQAVDVGLAVAVPVHSHIALNAVISDYVPKSMRATSGTTGATRWSALAVTGVAVAGLLKLSFTGPGVTSTVLELWRQPKEQLQ